MASATTQPSPKNDNDKDEEPDNDAVTIARKKVIAPISDPTAPPTEDLNALLAKEGMADLATEPDNSNGQMISPHPPGHVISPSAPASDAAPVPGDPSSIAL